MVDKLCQGIGLLTETITCRHCGSTDIVKNGLAPNNAKQKYFCHICGRQSRENPSPNGNTEERKEEILRAYQERLGLGRSKSCSMGDWRWSRRTAKSGEP
jgi:transposase-like protein